VFNIPNNYIYSIAIIQNCNTINNNLWHDRLGHLCDELAIFKQKYLYIHNAKSNYCNVFPSCRTEKITLSL